MRLFLCVAVVLCLRSDGAGQASYRWEEGGLRTSGRDDQIEIGGPLVGVEFHGSRPLPSRISFYAPVANSLDLSTDYWKRGDTRVIMLSMSSDGTPLRLQGTEAWEYRVFPHRVEFYAKERDLSITISYRCGLKEVPVAVSIAFRNDGLVSHTVEVGTHYALTLRSCQSYHRIDPTRVFIDDEDDVAMAEYDDPRLARPTLYVQRVGNEPASGKVGSKAIRKRVVQHQGYLEFDDSSHIKPGGTFTVTRIIGTSSEKEYVRTVSQTARSWRTDLQDYDDLIRAASHGGTLFRSGDAWTDSSVAYARAMLAANRHVLNGTVVPMPCPAEYNFFFTHDVLLTDLSAIFFDAARVKRDLLYLQRRSKNNDLPHAYYWKDDGFKTEYCNAGNWNNLWVILAAASYYRHTLDVETVRKVYPLVRHALEKTLTKRVGNVLHGIEPDWWDFGNATGARAYLTILTIRAIEEYVFLSSGLHQDIGRLAAYERTAQDLRTGLISELWDESRSYLFNTTPGGVDHHIYMGPLLSAVYGSLPAGHAQRLVATATKNLLDPAIGVRTVSPADFHTDSTMAFYDVKSNEAGGAYLYANGGIWYLGNAWYAWALRAIGDAEGAFAFFRRTMTLDGILQSPRGQPALYEYRYADTLSADHGRVDKPTMMWSAGFCIGTAYRLAGFRDNTWNVTVGDAAPAALEEVRATFVFGGLKTIVRRGRGAMVTRLTVDGRDIPSRILPLDAATGKVIDVEMGPIRQPFLDSVNAVLHTARFDAGAAHMDLVLSSYQGHPTSIRIITPRLARSVHVNGVPWQQWSVSSTPLGTIVITIKYDASSGNDNIRIIF